MASHTFLRQQVVGIYKGELRPINDRARKLSDHLSELLFLGREYPLGYSYFRNRLHDAFWGQRKLEDENDIKQGIQRAEYMKKGI